MSDLCIACGKAVGKRQHGVTCDVCDRWHIVFVGQVTIISLFVICFHCNINNSHVFWYNRINFINFHYVFLAGESAVEAYSCILHMFFFLL